MADKKISALTAAALPLAGTEVLPIVQSGATVKVATDDLTVKNIRSNATSGLLQVTGPAAASTRVMTTPDANFTAARIDAAQSFTGNQTLSTGNLIIGTSGKGIDFSATPGTGTSELLADYEEGTWTATITGSSTDGTASYTSQTGVYTKVGRMVSVSVRLTWSSATGTGIMQIAGLPFTAMATQQAAQITPFSLAVGDITYVSGFCPASTTRVQFYKYAAGTGSSISVEASGDVLMVMTYAAV